MLNLNGHVADIGPHSRILVAPVYIFAGENIYSDSSFCIIKLDSAGDTIWTREIRYDGINLDWWSVLTTGDKGIVLGGETKLFGANGYDIYLTKLDSNGIGYI